MEFLRFSGMQANFLSEFGKRIQDAIALWNNLELKAQKLKRHCFSLEDCGSTFFIERSQKDSGYYSMTGCGAAISSGDYITIQNSHHFFEYRVVDICFYEETPDVWLAQLLPIRVA
jgi:hypothetical protein